jgi:hypothetical protein
LQAACAGAAEHCNPYEIIGSGLKSDVAVTARLAMQSAVEELMKLFGSARQA